MKNVTLSKIYLICTVIFLITMILAYLYTEPTGIKELNNNINPSLLGIFLNNLKIIFLLVFLCPITLGISTFVIILINGLTLGGALGSIKNDLSLTWLLIPHGVIEIPILLMAATIGIRVTINLFSFRFNGRELFKSLFFIIVGLFLAATIETFVTPIFIKGV